MWGITKMAIKIVMCRCGKPLIRDTQHVPDDCEYMCFSCFNNLTRSGING